MVILLVCLFVIAAPSWAGELGAGGVYGASVAALASSAALDAASSAGLREYNHLLASGPQGTFGRRGALILAGSTAGALVAEWAVLRRHPRARRALTIVNFSLAGLHGWRAGVQFQIKWNR